MSKQHLYTVLVSLVKSISEDVEVTKQAENEAKQAFAAHFEEKAKLVTSDMDEQEAE